MSAPSLRCRPPLPWSVFPQELPASASAVRLQFSEKTRHSDHPMSQFKRYPQLANVIFLENVGITLRQTIGTTPVPELPEDIQRLLRKLERKEHRNALVTLARRKDPAA